jgi:hypothetical protein
MFVLSESASQMKIGKDQFNEKEIDKLFVFRFVVFLILILIFFFFFFFFFFEDVFFFFVLAKGRASSNRSISRVVSLLCKWARFVNAQMRSIWKGRRGRS